MGQSSWNSLITKPNQPMRQTKAQLQEINEKLNNIIHQQSRKLKELQEDYDLAARRLDRLLQKDFSLDQEVQKIQSIAEVIGESKFRSLKCWGLSWIELFVGVAVFAHIVIAYVLIASA